MSEKFWALGVMLIGIVFSVTLFHFMPIMTKSNTKRHELASNKELLNISQHLFDIDENNFLSFLSMNLQGFINSTNLTDDRAPEPLFNVSDAFFNIDIVQRMKVLYDNYEMNTKVDEIFTEEELTEERIFIDTLLETPVMKLAMNFLEEKGIVSNNIEAHRELIQKLWFDVYPRDKGTVGSSSGFEHIFLSEVKKGKIIGLHNWIYMAHIEESGQLDYKGWIKHIKLGDKAQIIKIRLSINNLHKPVSSLFIGTSPELEFALYTICFQLRMDKNCHLSYGGVNFHIRTYSLNHNGKKLIGSAFVAM